MDEGAFNSWAGDGGFGYYQGGDGERIFGNQAAQSSGDPAMAGSAGSLPYHMSRLGSDGEDAGSIAARYFQSLSQPDASGNRPWGTSLPGFNDSGSAWDPTRASFMSNGQERIQTGQGLEMLSPDLQEALRKRGIDPMSLFTHDAERGYSAPADILRSLYPAREAEALAGEDWIDQGGLGYALMAAATGGALSGFGGLGAAAGAGAEGAAGIGAGGLAAGEAGGGAFLGSAADLAAGSQAGFAQSLAPNFIGAQTPAFVGPGTTGLALGGAGGASFDSIDSLLKHIGEMPGAGGEGLPAGGAPPISGGETPPATMSGMAEKLGQGVSLPDMARLGLSNFGDIGNMISRFAIGPSGSGTGFGVLGGGSSPLSLIQGLYGMFQSKKLNKSMEDIARGADPQAQYRPEYAAMLNGLVKDPSTLVNMPGYKAAMEAVRRSMASQGYQGSGNMASAVASRAGQFYDSEVARLSNLAGGNPGQAAQIRASGKIDATNLLGQALSRMAYGFMRGGAF